MITVLLIIITVRRLNFQKNSRLNRKGWYKNVKIRVPSKYLSNFWKTLKTPLINCEINVTLTCSAGCFIIDAPIAVQEPTFTTTDTKLYMF